MKTRDKYTLLNELKATCTYRDGLIISAYMGDIMEWDKWRDEIPYISWPKSWEVKAIPPFCGAIIRYFVRLKENPDCHVSIYLDCYEQLGFYGPLGSNTPHWEIYPDKEDNNIRFAMNDVSGLLSAIKSSLAAQKAGRI